LIVPITNGAGRNVGGENALTQFSRGTGGRVFLPALGPELDRAFTEILRDLRTQYLIGYYPKAVPLTKNRFHTVKVGLRDPQWTAQTRTGYYGASL
jgi:Ca-activated chloride channel family protein